MTRQEFCSFFRSCASFYSNESRKASLLQDPASLSNSRMPIPQYKSVSRRNCCLLNFIWERDWPNAIRRIQSHPLEAFCITENTGRSALHLASFNHGCPLDVAEALLEANLHALWVTDDSNLTPLHYACTFKGGTDHLIPLFCYKLERMEDRYEGLCPDLGFNTGPSPLLLACRRNAPISVLRALLSSTDGATPNNWIAPETGGEAYWYNQSLPGSSNLSPLSALLKHLDVDRTLQLDRSVVSEFLTVPTTSRSRRHLEDECDEDAADILQKVALLVESGFVGYSGSMLHMVCSLKASLPSLVEIVGSVMNEQAICRDSLGYTPLHHVLLHPFAPSQLIKNVLIINERSSQIRTLEDNAYPLILAIRRGWEWDSGVAELVRANPEPLDITDTSIGLVPFLLAASFDAEVATIFELLRASPHLLCSISRDNLYNQIQGRRSRFAFHGTSSSFQDKRQDERLIELLEGTLFSISGEIDHSTK
jgi:ankyrin repeat protein